MGRVWHPIYSNGRGVKWGPWPEKCIHIDKRCVNGWNISVPLMNSGTHVLFWWCIFITSFCTQSKGGKYATWPFTWVTVNVQWSVREYYVPSALSELSGTPMCFRRKLGLLLMDAMYVIFSFQRYNEDILFVNWYLPFNIHTPDWLWSTIVHQHHTLLSRLNEVMIARFDSLQSCPQGRMTICNP